MSRPASLSFRRLTEFHRRSGCRKSNDATRLPRGTSRMWLDPMRFVLLESLGRPKKILVERGSRQRETPRREGVASARFLIFYFSQTGSGRSTPTHFTLRSLRFETRYGFSVARSPVFTWTSQFHTTLFDSISAGNRLETM